MQNVKYSKGHKNLQ